MLSFQPLLVYTVEHTTTTANNSKPARRIFIQLNWVASVRNETTTLVHAYQSYRTGRCICPNCPDLRLRLRKKATVVRYRDTLNHAHIYYCTRARTRSVHGRAQIQRIATEIGVLEHLPVVHAQWYMVSREYIMH